MRTQTAVVVALLGGSLMAGTAHSALPAPRLPGNGVYHLAGRSSPCARPARGRLVYHYPVRPFLRQHPIRGNFGDPRTISLGPFGADTARTPGSFSFHNGIDISAAKGTPVYPVVSGTARIGYADEVIVVTRDGRVFQYFHLRPSIRTGQSVVAYRTVLGRVRPRWGHVHLSEIDGFQVHNPADPGHLAPYRDETVPAVTRILFSDARGRRIEPTALHGRIQLAVEAYDTPPIRVPGAWLNHPVTPAAVSWRLSTSRHRLVRPWRTVADFRKEEPPNRDFWHVYGPGTFQNFPVFGARYFYGQPGRYVFRLTYQPLDTRRFGSGRYVLDVRVQDVCGNWSTWVEPVRMSNPPA